ncbi:hypothetical protein V8Z69_18320 [Microbacterium aurugineum]|uniref:hypothetical protein n=1 Tax=Microbacterium aurugineum TaxID=2851642 RepID=UPI0039BE455C
MTTRTSTILTHTVCPRCREDKPLTEFSTNPSKKNGHASYCRPCARERLREYRATDIGKLANRVASREYAARNRARNLALREASTTTP